jgi:hypothetical protein
MVRLVVNMWRRLVASLVSCTAVVVYSRSLRGRSAVI